MDNSANINFYCLSGLGADGRLFAAFKPDFGQVKSLDYIDPIDKNETLSDYVKRLARGINDTQPFILVGISLGGIMATEIAKIKRPEAIIYISTIKSSQEKTGIFTFIKRFKITSIFTFKRTQKFIGLAKWYFNTKDEYLLFKSMLRDTSPLFGQWAIHQIMNWNGGPVAIPFIQINGKLDELFPVAEGENVYLIPDKRHDMTLNSWPILNPMINKWLTELIKKPL